MPINHLQNSESNRKFLTVAFGRLPFTGHLCWSKSDATYVTAFNALGEGEWDAVEAVFWKGIRLAATEYEFMPGALATAMTTGAQRVSVYFPKDVPHSRTATLGYRIPVAQADADTLASPPLRMEGMARTKKSADYNNLGVQTGFSYSLNPARQIVQILTDYARLPKYPSAYASIAAYWLSRIDWGNWTAFRDFHEGTETVDYRTLPDYSGFGVRSKWYSGANFQTFSEQFTQPHFDINYSGVIPPATLTSVPLSVRFEGYIKFQYTETYTIYVTHDNGARMSLNGVSVMNLWADDGSAAVGTDSVTFAATAGAFTDFLFEWNDGGVIGQLKIEWQSASQAREVIPSKYLYPIAEVRKKYESSVWFDTPVSPIFAIDEILRITNSVRQEVNGKWRFFALESLTSSFNFNDTNIIEGTATASPPSAIEQSPVTEYRAKMRDSDRRFAEEPELPPSNYPARLSGREIENVKEVNLYSMTRWQAQKVLATTAKLETAKGLTDEFECLEAKSFPVIENDVVTVTHRKTGNVARTYLIREATDLSSDISRDGTGNAPRRRFRAQKWGVG